MSRLGGGLRDEVDADVTGLAGYPFKPEDHLVMYCTSL
jgi:hypothetical protein